MALTLLFQLRATATIPGWGRVLRLDRRPSAEIWGRCYKKLTFHSTRRQAINQPALRQQKTTVIGMAESTAAAAKSPHR